MLILYWIIALSGCGFVVVQAVSKLGVVCLIILPVIAVSYATVFLINHYIG